MSQDNNRRAQDTDLPEQQGPSKSAVKRELLALQGVGQRLMELGPRTWEQVELSTAVRDALEESRRLKGNTAMRRHVRRLGKLLRGEDAEQVKALFDRIDNSHSQDMDRFHRLERWRDRLIGEGDAALEELLGVCPEADRQWLRQMIRTARKELEAGKPPAASRKLFKYIRGLGLD
jgi:ribosome-associated protein